MKYPASIKIGYREYLVVEVEATNMPGLDGHTKHDPPQITMSNAVSPTRAASTLLHEVLHGIYQHYAMDEGGITEERTIETFSNGLATVIHDNPGFAAWLAEHLEPKP